MLSHQKKLAVALAAPLTGAIFVMAIAGPVQAEVPHNSAIAVASASRVAVGASGHSYSPGDIATVTLDPGIDSSNIRAFTDISVSKDLKIVGMSAPTSVGHSFQDDDGTANYVSSSHFQNDHISLKVQVLANAQPSEQETINLHTVGVKNYDVAGFQVPTKYDSRDSGVVNVAGPRATGSVDVPARAKVGDEVPVTAKFDHVVEYNDRKVTLDLPAGMSYQPGGDQPVLPAGWTETGIKVNAFDESEVITFSEDKIHATGEQPIVIPITVMTLQAGDQQITANLLERPTLSGPYELACSGQATITVAQ